MKQYIDKDKVVAEINKRIIDAPIDYIGHQRVWAYNDVKDILNALEVKGVDLEEEIELQIRNLQGVHTFENEQNWWHGTYDDLREFARYFAEWKKEQMTKGLCYETKVYHDSDGTAEDGNYEERWNLGQSEIIDIPVDELGLKDGDIVKVIIIKEEEE